MNVSLTPELESLVQQKVQSGLYTSASEVVREALRLLNDRDTIQQQRLAELKREVKVGFDELDRGEGISQSKQTLAAMFDDIKQEIAVGLDDLKHDRTVPGEQVFEELKSRSKKGQNH